MEKNLEKTFDEILQTQDVQGFSLVDNAGLCLGVKANAEQYNTGVVKTFAEACKKIDSNHMDPKIIILEGESWQCLIQHKDDLTGLLHKSTPVNIEPDNASM